MSELQAYYDAFRQGYWADPDPEACLCRGRGWALSDVDTWHECPIHYKGQLHPDSYDQYDTYEEWDRANKAAIARRTGEVQQDLIDAGLQSPSGAVACGYCGEFGHAHGKCPPQYVCPECEDGMRFPPTECPRCRDTIRREMAEAWQEMPAPETPSEPPKAPNEGDIPF